jgi:hypothetical protein
MPQNNYLGVVPGNGQNLPDPYQPRAGFTKSTHSTLASSFKPGKGIAGHGPKPSSGTSSGLSGGGGDGTGSRGQHSSGQGLKKMVKQATRQYNQRTPTSSSTGQGGSSQSGGNDQDSGDDSEDYTNDQVDPDDSLPGGAMTDEEIAEGLEGGLLL